MEVIVDRGVNGGELLPCDSGSDGDHNGSLAAVAARRCGAVMQRTDNVDRRAGVGRLHDLEVCLAEAALTRRVRT
jgi:hypothetical protein